MTKTQRKTRSQGLEVEAPIAEGEEQYVSPDVLAAQEGKAVSFTLTIDEE